MCKEVIDTHAHIWPSAYLDMLEKAGSKNTEIARIMQASTSKEDMKQRFDNMDRAGVKKQILSATPQVPEWGDEEEAYKISQYINNAYKKIIDKYPERFDAYGVVCLPFVDKAIEEAKRCIKDLGFKGIALNTLVRDKTSIADDGFDKFFKAMDELKTIIYIHPTGNGAKSCLVNDYGLEWVVGAPIEDMLISLHLLKKEFPQKYPNIKFHISHLGGGLSFQIQRIEDNYEDWKAFSTSPWKNFKKNFYFDGANFSKYALMNAVDVFGYEKIMMGSDFPYFKDEKYTRAVDYIKNSGLSEAKVAAILKDNASNLYGYKEK